ncbi:MAG: phosphatase domain-containing protein [Ginsengibacter sp.]
MFKKIRDQLLHLFKLNNKPVIKVYRGYGDAGKIIVFGHVLKLSPLGRKTYRQSWVVNIFSMLRLFMVKPYQHVKLQMEWDGQVYDTESQDDGFFRFELTPVKAPVPGWHNVRVNLNEEKYLSRTILGEGEFHIPVLSQYAFISDIDDTFLISHSSNLRRRLYVLFTKNARSRKPFEGVTKHYQLLAQQATEDKGDNSFFYVSSSEWNLYDFIVEFSRENQLPYGVYLLNQLKQLSQVLLTGQNKHTGKFTRIVRIIETYPHMQFVLLGDDTQEDPNIYLAVAEHFPANIFAVYIRRVNKTNFTTVEQTIAKIEIAGVHCCYFLHSTEAIEHSRSIGLIR